MNDLEDLNLQFEEFIEHLERAVKKAGEHVVPVFLGANPSLLALANSLIMVSPATVGLHVDSKNSGYVDGGAEIQSRARRFRNTGLPPPPAGQIAGFCGDDVQPHPFNLIPSIILHGANSRLFAGRVFPLHEQRIFMYDQSERQNSSFQGIPCYLAGAKDCVDYMISRKHVIAKDYSELFKERHDDCRLRLEANNNYNNNTN
ncbi:MAG TPA: hypothetical protein VHA09_03700, partial [Nitrososphaera sp.]|nr:hypothetical protein [Nitrososphaera sp.]